MSEPGRRVTIREELRGDRRAIDQLHRDAFYTDVEARIVEGLRRSLGISYGPSLVADDGGVVGHVLLSRIALLTDPLWFALALGPIAVTPSRQRQGIGTALTQAVLERATLPVVVLGEPEFYGRFGFRLAAESNLVCPFPGADWAYQVWVPAGARPPSGEVRYPPPWSVDAPATGT